MKKFYVFCLTYTFKTNITLAEPKITLVATFGASFFSFRNRNRVLYCTFIPEVLHFSIHYSLEGSENAMLFYGQLIV